MADTERKFFGTDGVRGIANVYPLVPEVAMALGRAIAVMFPGGQARTRILIGKDTRISGYMFESALATGALSMGADVLFVGPIPTPGIAYLTIGNRADAGVVISASHNPFMDNGIKFFGRDGFKLPDEIELKVEELVQNPSRLPPVATGKDFGRASRIDDAIGRYCVHLKSQFPRDRTLEGIRIALDCANGAGYKVAPMVFAELGAEVVTIGDKPDGTNINEACGALHPKSLGRKVRELRCDVGLALDGDGDRAMLVDEHGNIVDGDGVMAICAENMLQEGRLKGGGVVGTIMTNIGLEIALKKRGLHVIRTDVGDRYVVERMLADGYNLGGEQSGHLLFLDHSTTGDGILSGLMVLEVMLKTGRRLSELAGGYEKYPQVNYSRAVVDRPPIESLAQTNQAVREVEAALGEQGRVVVRYSGTSKKIRVMVEGPDEGMVQSYAEQILAACGRDEILE
ncbi:MAG TPA: phosphoglucosamine mutase [Myxococcota bacterium]|nr:phosphoglucosamine mutase [Myxococcota bacterium]HOH77019.1 phosphoglucosamine mutase [Myxococcota bacterium]